MRYSINQPADVRFAQAAFNTAAANPTGVSILLQKSPTDIVSFLPQPNDDQTWDRLEEWAKDGWLGSVQAAGASPIEIRQIEAARASRDDVYESPFKLGHPKDYRPHNQAQMTCALDGDCGCGCG
jgi:hypothetical protein